MTILLLLGRAPGNYAGTLSVLRSDRSIDHSDKKEKIALRVHPIKDELNVSDWNINAILITVIPWATKSVP